MKHTDIKEVENFISHERGHLEDDFDEEQQGYIITKPSRKLGTSRRSAKPFVVLGKDLILYFNKVREMFFKQSGYDPDSYDSDCDNPVIFILGQKNNIIGGSELIRTSGGCGEMTYISTEKFNEAMFKLIKRKYYPAGIARIGFFGNRRDAFGGGFEQLSEFVTEQGLCFLSVGRSSMYLDFIGQGHVYKRITNYSIK